MFRQRNGRAIETLFIFELFASADASFTSLTSLGSFTGVVQSVGTLAQVFDMADATTQHIRIKGSAVNGPGGGNLVNIGEVAFEASRVVPEPTSLVLWSVGLVGIAFNHRRRTR